MKLLSALFEVTAYSAVLFAAVMGFKLAFKSRLSPALHFALWFLVIARLCIPVTVESDFHFFAASKPGGEAELQAPVPEAPEERTTAFTGGEAISDAPSVEAPAPAPAAAAIPAAAPKRKPVSSWADALTALWIAGMAFRAARLLFSERSMRRAVAHNTLPTDARTRDIYDACCAELGIAHKLPLQSMAGIYSPALTVSLKPMILLPANITDTLSEAQLAYALRHELMHYRRRDHLLALLLLLLTCVYWFNPVVWLMKRELMKDMETTCDSAVTARLNGAERREYAMTLLALFSQPYRVNSVLGMALSSAEKDAERRVRGLFLARRSKAAIKALAASLASLLLLCCFTTACQPTPEIEQVGNKGSSVMDESLKEDSISPRSLNIPEKYFYEHTSSNGKIKVTTDAGIVFTDNDALPVYSAKIAPFTEQQIEKVINILFGEGAVLSKNDIELSKAELMEKLLLPAQQQLAEVQSGKEIYEETGLLTEQELMNRIDVIKEQIAKAPDKPEISSVSVKDYLTSSEGLHAYSVLGNGEKASIWVTNGNDIYPIWLIFEMENREYDEYADRGIDKMILATTPDEAIDQAEQFLDRIGVNYMDFCAISSTSRLGENEYENNSEANLSKTAYAVTFTRTVSGIPCAYDNNYCEGAYSKPFYAERIRIHIDDTGIVGVYWYGNTVIQDMVSQNVKLYPFNDMVSHAAAQLGQKSVEFFSTPFDNGIRKISYKIDKIVLGYARVINKNSQDKYLLIPVWDFYGQRTIEFDHEYIDKQNAEYGQTSDYMLTESFDVQPFVTANALDGTIVDRTLGY